ncbi:UDP-GalNAc:beta-1,3-N-acetylgalactosaminyltransferase 2 [Ciona intestinalis]
MLSKVSALSALIAFIAVLICIWKSNDSGSSESTRYKLVLGVLSARDHFKERQVIRDTWMKLVTQSSTLKNKILIKFVLGEKDCEIPPAYRTDIYSCQNEKHWESDLEVPLSNSLAIESLTQCDFGKYEKVFKLVAIDFVVKHAVVLTGLSLFKGTIKWSDKQSVRVELRDLAKNDVVTYSEFQKRDFDSNSCLVTQDVENYILPKGFYGTVVVYCPDSSGCSGVIKSGGIDEIMNHPAVSYSPVFKYGYNNEEVSDMLGFPEYELYGPIIPALFQFYLQDENSIKALKAEKKKQFDSWEERNRKIDTQLKEEVSLHKDVLLVPNVKTKPTLPLTDVYRNLPLKLLAFFKWTTENVHCEFVGKIDDDSFVDINNILQVIKRSGVKENSWFGSFRGDIPVARWGKWAELAYTANIYPAFAYGGGYVITSDIALWLATNAQMLHPYQGEDVSMGIWLAALKPELLPDKMWFVNAACHP